MTSLLKNEKIKPAIANELFFKFVYLFLQLIRYTYIHICIKLIEKRLLGKLILIFLTFYFIKKKSFF
jgi:hypothetical protein